MLGLKPLPQSYGVAPCALFRISWAGRKIRLLVRTPETLNYDIETTEDSYVRPTSEDLSNYQTLNGARMTPNAPFFHMFVKKLKKSRPGLLIHGIPEGTVVTKGLLLVQDKVDRFSIHPRERMATRMFEYRLTNFMHRYGKVYTRNEWLEAHPLPDPKPRSIKTPGVITRSVMHPWKNNELAERLAQMNMRRPLPTDGN